MGSPPTIAHQQVSSVELLRQLPSWQRINHLPFRFLHSIACATFLYFYLTHVPEEPDELAAPDTLPDTPATDGGTDLDEFDELDAVVQPQETAEAPGAADGLEMPEMWEPKTPQDYVRVVWAFILLFHALVNLFCVWMVRVKIFCQFKRVRSVDQADHVLCVPPENHGNAAISPLVRRQIQVAAPGTAVPETVRFCGPLHLVRAGWAPLLVLYAS